MIGFTKATFANVMASAAIAAGIAGYFLGIEPSESILLITGAGIGYLFKNGNINVLRTNETKDTD